MDAWQVATRSSLVANSILLVVLAGGSHAITFPPYQTPLHIPVHQVYDLSVRLDLAEYQQEIYAAGDAWDQTAGGGNQVILDLGAEGNDPFDLIVVDADAGAIIDVPLRAHNGQEGDYEFNTSFGLCSTCWVGVAKGVSASDSGVDQVMHIVVFNTSLYVTEPPGIRWRVATHEFGHVLGLDDHSVPNPQTDCSAPDEYDGMMDNSCYDNYPYDFIIWNLLNIPSVADEASCVRKVLNLSGKKRCG